MCGYYGPMGGKLRTQKLFDYICTYKGMVMCGNYCPMEGKLRTQKLLDCALIRVWLCAAITVLWAVN